MSKASIFAARVKAAKERPQGFEPTGNVGDATIGQAPRAYITDHGEADIEGCFNAVEANRLIKWLVLMFED